MPLRRSSREIVEAETPMARQSLSEAHGCGSGFAGATLLAGQAVVGWHFGSAWSLNRKPFTAPGPLSTQPIALAA